MQCVIFKIFTIFFVVIVKAKSYFKYRVVDGKDDVNNEFPYVVSIQLEKKYFPHSELYRACTGTLIAPEWVLTAAHCLVPEVKFIRYGNMTVSRNATDSMRVILKMIPHPNCKIAFFLNENDIGLILISKIQMPSMGKLSSIDYRTMTGLNVRYAGFGFIGNPILDEFKPLQLGQGVVTKCFFKRNSFGPRMCIAPKCIERHHEYARGDSGGPIFYDGKIVAVISGKYGTPQKQSITSPVSPHLDWIRDTIMGQHNIAGHATELAV